MGRISGRPWGIPVAAYGENLMATHKSEHVPARGACKIAASDPAGAEVRDGRGSPPGSDESQLSVAVRAMLCRSAIAMR